MPRVRQGGGNRWVNRTSMSVEEYRQGVSNPRTDWAQATTQAESSYNQGIQESISRGGFRKGVQNAGTAKWQEKALGKGAARFPQGVQEGRNDYETGVAPYLQTIETTVLPPRYPKGDPRNINRVAVLAKALRDKKLAGGQ